MTWSLRIISEGVLTNLIKTSRPKLSHLLDNGGKLHIGKLEDSIEIIYFGNLGGKLIPAIRLDDLRIKTLLS